MITCYYTTILPLVALRQGSTYLVGGRWPDLPKLDRCDTKFEHAAKTNTELLPKARGRLTGDKNYHPRGFQGKKSGTWMPGDQRHP